MISASHAATDPAPLLAAVDHLELIARRNAAGRLAGDYLTATRGSGMVFHESRKYVPGDPARKIDWLATARTGEPYVRVHQEERQREVLIALDVSPSMQVGFRARSKIETAVELAATLAFSAVEGGDRLGHVVFADRVLDSSPPRAGRTQLFRVLRSFVAFAGTTWERRVLESDPRVAIHAMQKTRGGPFVVFMISDFIDHDLPEDLKYLRARHDVSLLHVHDPVEFAGSPDVVLPARSPEGDPGLRRWRPGETESFEEKRDFLRKKAARHRIAITSCSTDEEVRRCLIRHFHRKRRLFA